MPQFEVVTPLRNGGKEPVPPGELVTLSEVEGGKLAAIGAVKRISGKAADVDPTPATAAKKPAAAKAPTAKPA